MGYTVSRLYNNGKVTEDVYNKVKVAALDRKLILRPNTGNLDNICLIDNWIPVKLRKPEENRPVLVTFKDIDNNLQLCIGRYNTEKCLWETTNTDDLNVIAWQDLPEPYRGKG